MTTEIIALLSPDGARTRPSRSKPVEALIRRGDGQMTIERVRDGKSVKGSTWFRPGREIRDPDTREVIGYEMEPVVG